MDRLPSPTQLASLYDDAYDGATTGYFAKVDSKMRRSLHRVRQLRRRVSGGRFLDIGCSGGFMVEAARLQGFGAHGVEVDPKSVAYAREHYPANAYFHGTVQAFAESHGGEPLFDAVYCSEVIEHVPESRSFVAAIAGLMRPGAVLYITTPDISHWRRPKELTNWDAFCPPSHCVFFNPANLTRLLAAHDLVVFKRFISLKPGVKLLARKS
ncbi:MAG: methyltransferase domain-containing protein [Proteobacteria bacterium]|nr:methyltransferase domain-containing protein [Pseudomonadota bacterium]MDA1354875.1 methyltransferase domain-containing protein [Pseudomonadota bacterium]